MNSNGLRYVAAGAQLIVVALGVFKVIDPGQTAELTGAILAAYHFAQGQLTPATNARTPDDAPGRSSLPPSGPTPTP